MPSDKNEGSGKKEHGESLHNREGTPGLPTVDQAEVYPQVDVFLVSRRAQAPDGIPCETERQSPQGAKSGAQATVPLIPLYYPLQ